jgi:hypothetical protein
MLKPSLASKTRPGKIQHNRIVRVLAQCNAYFEHQKFATKNHPIDQSRRYRSRCADTWGQIVLPVTSVLSRYSFGTLSVLVWYCHRAPTVPAYRKIVAGPDLLRPTSPQCLVRFPAVPQNLDVCLPHRESTRRDSHCSLFCQLASPAFEAPTVSVDGALVERDVIKPVLLGQLL